MKFAIISSNRHWGGSEELWAATAARLAAAGHRVTVYKSGLSSDLEPVRALAGLSCRLVDIGVRPRRLRTLPLIGALLSGNVAMLWQVAALWLNLLLRRRPDLILVSQGGNHDGWPLIAVCRRLGLPYACVSHKATDLYWPADRWRQAMRRGFEAARGCFFVSEHNLRLTEQQIGAPIADAELVRNPFNVAWGEPQPWPAGEEGLRLGCVGRLNVLEKGQDILLRVLASEKWRSRPISLTVVGDGEQRRGLEAMAAVLGLANVRFAGQTDDIPGFWRAHHALVLPSRAEGLPLVLVEAMLSARPAIVTDVGGNAELLDEGLTGFIADAPTEKSLDAALERAWARRDDWPAIGAAAAAYARTVMPSDPAAVFAARLLALGGEAGAAPRAARRPWLRLARRVRPTAGALEE